MLNFIFLVLGVGGAIVGALTLPESWWKYAIIISFGLIGLLGLGLIVRDWWISDPPPKFKLTISGVNIEHGFAENPLKCRYLITGSIENDGGASIAKNWKLKIEPPGKAPQETARLIIHSDSVFGVPGGDRRALSPSQSLSGQTGNQEVKGTIEGYEWFEATPLS
jgi:hypothetical protein